LRLRLPTSNDSGEAEKQNELAHSIYVWIKIHTRPASRDMRNDARSGNINHAIRQKGQRPKQQTTL
jgi:hypothetical protein